LLEDNWSDALRQELADNFQNLARETGPKTLVVRGLRPGSFAAQVLASYALDHDVSARPRLPALLIVDRLPNEVKGHDPRAEGVRMILLPLADQYVRPGSVTDLLLNVAKTLKNPNGVKSLDLLDKRSIEMHWGWLVRYADLKPNFMGFGVNINAILRDMMGPKS
jgi:hypothetical protein